MLLRHLAPAVQDEQRSREFYERWFVEIAEFCDEPDYVSVKCRDPDGYVVEAAWEPD
jgi:hypothetical protein